MKVNTISIAVNENDEVTQRLKEVIETYLKENNIDYVIHAQKIVLPDG